MSNAYFLEKFRFDTAENEPAKNLQNLVKFCKFAKSSPPVISIALPTLIDASEVTADVVDRVQEGDGERIDHHRFRILRVVEEVRQGHHLTTGSLGSLVFVVLVNRYFEYRYT